MINGHISDSLSVNSYCHNEPIPLPGNPPIFIDVTMFRKEERWRIADVTLTIEEVRGLAVFFSEIATKAEAVGERWTKRDARRKGKKAS